MDLFGQFLFKLLNSSLLCVHSVRTELVGEGAISRLAITQADVRHSGVYTCAVSDNISQSLRLHIIDGKNNNWPWPMPVSNCFLNYYTGTLS